MNNISKAQKHHVCLVGIEAAWRSQPHWQQLTNYVTGISRNVTYRATSSVRYLNKYLILLHFSSTCEFPFYCWVFLPLAYAHRQIRLARFSGLELCSLTKYNERELSSSQIHLAHSHDFSPSANIWNNEENVTFLPPVYLAMCKWIV